MNFFKSFDIELANIHNRSFEKLALDLFKYQSVHNEVYRSYLTSLPFDTTKVTSIKDIPFLPIEFFKSHIIKTNNWEAVKTFRSSGTTGNFTSRHYVDDIERYERHCERIFEFFYGPVTSYHILALLPSYLERDDASLVAMCQHLIKRSGKSTSGFYLDNFDALFQNLKKLQQNKEKVLLIGVTFALLDFVDRYKLAFPDLIVMETGGMKGRRKEMVRDEVHRRLSSGFGVKQIHSEYGMTELFSQSYSNGSGLYRCPPWMSVMIRDISDPFSSTSGKSGVIKVCDLANRHSCAFIETQDLGRLYDDGSFEVLGRMDNSEQRGCNLMVS